MTQELLLKAYTVERSMPENYVGGELDFCRAEFSYKTLDVKLITVANAMVSDKGFVYDSYFKINENSLLNPLHYVGYFTFKHYLKKVLLRKKRSLDPKKKYLLVFDEWSYTHYHWFCDLLPRIFAIRDSVGEYCLLLPNHSTYIKEVGLKSLEHLGIRPKEVEFIKEREIVKIWQLTIVTHACIPGRVNDFLIEGLSKLFRRNITPIETNNRKIYISRKKAKFRKVLNEEDVVAVMKSFNYEICYYEDMSFEEQFAITSNAHSMVSIHGAGLANSLFLPPQSSILEFRRDKIYHNQCFWHLADAMGHKYYYLFGSPDDEDLIIEGEGCNLTIDIEKLKETVGQMERDQANAPSLRTLE